LYQSNEAGFLLCKLKRTEVGGEVCAISIQLPSVCRELNTSKKKISGPSLLKNKAKAVATKPAFLSLNVVTRPDPRAK